MIIIGSKGFAKEVLEVIKQSIFDEELFFYDDISSDLPGHLFSQFRILHDFSEAKRILKEIDPKFTLGIGNPKYREQLYKKFLEIGGVPYSTISPKATIGKFGNRLGECLSIMTGVVITSDCTIGDGTLINLNATIGHDCNIGRFVEISPNVNISGRCKIGDFTVMGTSSVVIPDIEIGKNSIIGAGTVVTKDIPDYSLVVGVPGKVIKNLNE